MIAFFKTKTFRQHFLPAMVLIIGGSFLLKEFAKIRYKYKKVTSHDIHKEAELMGIKMSKPLTLEEEYEKTMSKIDLDNWENVRIPRPWDETLEAKK
ncbi:cytochrome c oxidase assembly protein COX16 homolog l(3)neo43 [Megachile rotundata]|uniref:cytochrome c oxidase assembly protein COX16 homolog l(3)neo43 n=1 Tax=Megachile rotundata TaxID=143995 RepID=UPI000258E9C9|nr:PREDICTED: cytochrome c oxidase assembly protein COX16 homolog, mitochondrial [Megachile rotundata]XP_012147062.1 PREDICTED: cytochrome c oxidase assembly protein COX16 homolog, mitochondrial [Megachile rotundata]